MYPIAEPVSFTDTEASILMDSPLYGLDCLLVAAENKRCPDTCCGIENPLFKFVISPVGANDFDPNYSRVIPFHAASTAIPSSCFRAQ